MQHDHGFHRIPQFVETEREVLLHPRQASPRALLLALGGLLVLCICFAVGLCGAVYALGLPPFGDAAALNLPFVSGSKATPTLDANKPTPVPFGKNSKDTAGLRVTVASFQRPLPAQDIEIPRGQELALVAVRLENTRTTGGPIKFAPEDFKLVSPEGDEFAPVTTGITTGELLKKGEVAVGKTVKGDLIFYVYSDIKEVLLAWTPADGTTRLFKLTRTPAK